MSCNSPSEKFVAYEITGASYSMMTAKNEGQLYVICFYSGVLLPYWKLLGLLNLYQDKYLTNIEKYNTIDDFFVCFRIFEFYSPQGIR